MESLAHCSNAGLLFAATVSVEVHGNLSIHRSRGNVLSTLRLQGVTLFSLLFGAVRSPLGSRGAKVGLARRLGLIDAPVELALYSLRQLRKAFAHTVEPTSLADPAHSARLANIHADALTKPVWTPPEAVLAIQKLLAHGPLVPPSGTTSR